LDLRAESQTYFFDGIFPSRHKQSSEYLPEKSKIIQFFSFELKHQRPKGKFHFPGNVPLSQNPILCLDGDPSSMKSMIGPQPLRQFWYNCSRGA